MGLVFCDFDGTLTVRDTIWPFASFLCHETARPAAVRASLLLCLLELKLRLISNHLFKERFLRLLVRDESEKSIAEFVGRFHKTRLESILNFAMVSALAEHAAAGDDVYLVSSNFDFFLKPLERRWNLKGIFATQAEAVDGRFTGRIRGRACHGKEKLGRVVASLGERRTREAVAYGDSRSDSNLLHFVKVGHWVGSRTGVNVARSLRPA